MTPGEKIIAGLEDALAGRWGRIHHVHPSRAKMRAASGAIRHGIGITQVGRCIDPRHFYARSESDPMQISFHISEIANGVLAWTSNGWTEGSESEKTFFPNLFEAYKAAPEMMAAAHAHHIEQRAALEATWDTKKWEERAKQHDWARDPVMPEVRGSGAVAGNTGTSAQNQRLPEEEAAMGAVESVPSVFDDEASEAITAIPVEPKPGFVIGSEQFDADAPGDVE